MQTEYFVDDGDQGRDEGKFRFEVPVAASPVDLGIKRNERAFVEIARHRGGVELPPCVRIDKRRGQMKQAKGRSERENQQEWQMIAILHGVTGAIGVRRFE